MPSPSSSGRNLGRFRVPPTVAEIALSADDATRIAADLRRLAAVSSAVLLGTISPPARAPRLAPPTYYLKRALLVESRLLISWHEEARLERALSAYRTHLDREKPAA